MVSEPELKIEFRPAPDRLPESRGILGPPVTEHGGAPRILRDSGMVSEPELRIAHPFKRFC